MPTFVETFGKEISQLISRGNKGNPMAAECHFFTDKMIVQFNMTRARMMDRVGSEIGGTNVVTVEHSRK